MKNCKKCGRKIEKESSGKWGHKLTNKEENEIYEAQEAGAHFDEEQYFGHKPKKSFWSW
jgi:hypothetical protein